MIFVSQQMLNAGEFLSEMPDGFPYPSFSEDPDGDISLDWIVNRTSMVSISIGRDQRIPFAEIWHGTGSHCVFDYGDWSILQRRLAP